MTEEATASVADRAAVPRGLLWLLSTLTFALSFNSGILNPVLPDVAADLGVSVAAAGQLATAALLVGAVAALAIGTLSDLYGRRAFIVGGLAMVGVSAVTLATSSSFASALAGRALSGFGFIGAVMMALAGDHFGGARRDRAVARLLVADATAWVVGVPAMALLAAAIGWRVGLGAFGALVLLMAALAAVSLPADRRPARTKGLRAALGAIWRDHRGRPELAFALAANAARITFFNGFNTYASAFYIHTFGLETWHMGPLLAGMAIAFIVGAEVGGRGVARVSPRSLTAIGLLAGGVLLAVLPLVANLSANLAVAAAYCVLGGMATSGLVALVLRLAPESRGTTMALNSSLSSIGAAAGASVGGIGIVAFGYAGLGLSLATFALLAAALARLSARAEAVHRGRRSDRAVGAPRVPHEGDEAQEAG